MVVKIVMVCLGNICRSPLAEGILASKLPHDRFKVDSAGTGAWHIGSTPDSRSIAIAKKNNLDISHQRGRQFKLSDFEHFDYIYVMDQSNYNDVLRLAKKPEDIAKVKMILNELSPNQNIDVPDPYYGGDNGFGLVFDMLDQACENIASKLLKKHL
jgi:protein-tyrosine phosphatase